MSDQATDTALTPTEASARFEFAVKAALGPRMGELPSTGVLTITGDGEPTFEGMLYDGAVTIDELVALLKRSVPHG